MRIDLFEFVEGLFRGIVYFIYNVVETTAAIIRHPIKGPIRLYRLHITTERRQLGGLTYLFIASLLLQWVVLHWLLSTSRVFYERESAGPSDLSALREKLAAISLSPPTFDIDTLWPLILGSLVSTVIIDAVLRLALRWRFPRRVRRRQMLLAACEYSLLWMILAALSGAVISTLLVDVDRGQLDLAGLYLWGGLAVLAASFPAAAILRSTRSSKLGTDLDWLMSAIRMLGIFALFSLAWFTGIRFSSDAQSRRLALEYHDFPAHVRTLRCTVLPDGMIDVDGLIYVKQGAAQAFGDGHFALDIVPPGRNPRVRSGRLGWRTARANHFVAVGEGAPILVELQAPKYKRPRGAQCLLKARDAVSDGNGIPFTRDCTKEYGSPDRAEGLPCWNDAFNRDFFEKIQW